MSNDVVLTAALRNNLLSLQRTQSSIDTTQLRLATGKKVNSALDNPQNFFASNSLKNRASDLQRLLDGIGQNIQVIKAADNGVTALTKLVEQADSVAQSARDALAQGVSEAKVTGNKDLRGIDDLTGLDGIPAGGGTITLSITDEDGETLDINAYGGAGAPQFAVNVGANDSVNDIVARINDIHIEPDGGTTAVGEQAFEAKVNDAGQLEIRTLNGGDMRMVFAAAASTTDEEDLAFAADLGFGGLARVAGDQTSAATTSVELTAVADVAPHSISLYRQDGAQTVIADRSTLLSDLVEDDGATSVFAGIDDSADVFTIALDGGAEEEITLVDANDEAITVQGFIDAINNNGALNTRIRAEWDDETGQISLRSIDSNLSSIQVGFNGDTAADAANLGFGLQDLTTVTGGDAVTENIQLGRASALLAEYEVEYNNIRDQITQLVSNGDTGYRGTNLLNGDNLTTFFNEFRSSSLQTEGVTFTAEGLGLGEADFSRAETVDGALASVREALESVRAFGSTLANDLSMIQTRQDFTTDLINTLTEGSDKLVNADQNEEGAKLLALQTRQQLGVTSLSLASQSQQSILRLF